MGYRLLTPTHFAQIHQNKLLDLEALHARLSLDVQLAENAGASSEQLVAVRNDLGFVDRQLTALLTLIDDHQRTET